MSLRIAIDLTALLPEPTGVDTYMIQLVRSLGRVDRENEYRIFVTHEDRDIFCGALPDNFTVMSGSSRARSSRLWFQQVRLPMAARRWRADVVHSPSFIMPMYRAGAVHVVTIHDLTFFSLPDCHRALHRSAFYRRAVLASIKRADMIAVPSSATREHLAALMPDLPPHRTRVIPQGVGEEFRVHDAASIRAAAQRLRWPSSYLLYVGTIEPRKNLGQLIEAYRRLVTVDGIREDLVIVGRLGWKYDGVLAQLRAPELRGRVHLTGYLDQADLPLVYAGAKVFVYPSLQEGFGFPPLEAMASGVPTISSRSSSLSENLEGAAELVPPGDLDALTDAVRRLLRDEARRSVLAARGLARAARYRWETTAKDTLACYEQAAQREVVPRGRIELPTP